MDKKASQEVEEGKTDTGFFPGQSISVVGENPQSKRDLFDEDPDKDIDQSSLNRESVVFQDAIEDSVINDSVVFQDAIDQSINKSEKGQDRMNQTVMSFKSFAKEDDFFDLPIQHEESKG